jgi:hypothetical protein
MIQPIIRPAFGFSNENTASVIEGAAKLCIEVGQFHVALTISNLSGDLVSHFDLYTAKQKIDAAFLQSVLTSEKLEGVQFSEVIFVHNQKEMVLVPSSLYKQELDAVLMDTIHGDLMAYSIAVDDVHQWELHNVFGLSTEMLELVLHQYPQARKVQYMSACLKGIFRTLTEDVNQWIKLYVLPSCINLVVLKGEQLQIAKSFYYETPEDIIYHLLNVVDKYDLDVSEVTVEVSGLLDLSSATWKELGKYFLNISMEKCPSFSGENATNTDLPSHYFTPFLLVPRCV